MVVSVDEDAERGKAGVLSNEEIEFERFDRFQSPAGNVKAVTSARGSSG